MHTFALDATVTSTTMDTILTSVGTVFEKAVEWMGTILETVVSSPALLLMVVAMPVIGFAVGLLSRLIRL